MSRLCALWSDAGIVWRRDADCWWLLRWKNEPRAPPQTHNTEVFCVCHSIWGINGFPQNACSLDTHRRICPSNQGGQESTIPLSISLTSPTQKQPKMLYIHVGMGKDCRERLGFPQLWIAFVYISRSPQECPIIRVIQHRAYLITGQLN